MKHSSVIQLLLNEESLDHAQIVTKLLKRAIRLECLVAFAKMSPLNDMIEEMKGALSRGLEARFAIGLSFYLTEPDLLRELLRLSKRHALELYLSNSSETFHPKIYAFQNVKQCSVLIGSANFTNGGLSDNYEASAMIKDVDGSLMASVTRHFDALITQKVIVPATKPRIDEYERKYVIHDAWRKVAKKRAEGSNLTDTQNYTLLHDILELMKEDDSERGFDTQKANRRDDRHQARTMLDRLASRRGNARDFLQHYEALIRLFHSSGLHRSKTQVANCSDQFLTAVADIVRQKNLSPSKAFDVLHGHFSEISGAGINLLTEILHALNNTRFAVMNQNAVSGMMREIGRAHV